MADGKRAAGANAEDSLLNYMESISTSRPLSPREEAALARRIRKGDLSARDRLVEANLRFVVRVAREYRNLGAPLNDLISAGNVGLIQAAERFDETKGFKFITYAVWWIRQQIMESLSDYPRLVRLPSNRLELLHKIGRCIKSSQSKSNSLPSNEEIARELGITVGKLVDTVLKGRDVLSLDAVFDGANFQSLMDVTPDQTQESPEEQLARTTRDSEIQSALGTLEERERDVLLMYFGLDGKGSRTLNDIGCDLGVSRERVRQIKEKALIKLRHPMRGQKLLKYALEM